MECIIREWKIEDAAGLAEMLNNKNILNNLRDGLPYPYTKSDAEEYIMSMLSADKTKTFAFAITRIIESLAKDTSLNYLSVRNGLTSDLIYIPASIPNPVSNIYHNEEIEDNCLNIWEKSIIHTGEEKSEQYYLVPMRSGEYVIKISVICEEMEKQVVQDFVVKVK